MLRRFFVGLVLGAVVGAALAAVIVSGLGVVAFTGTLGVLLAYGASAVSGMLTGLVAGKPVWAEGAKTEAGLKAVFGALLAAGAMFALRQWAGGWTLDLTALHGGGPAPIGALPAAALPLIASTLGGFFELDNTGDSAPANRRRVAATASAKVRAPQAEQGASEDEDEAPSAASRRIGH